MTIHEFYHNEKLNSLVIQFSLKNDTENTYRNIELMEQDIIYYSPTIVTREDIAEFTISDVVELLNNYFFNNEPSEEQLF
jgi:hypothetical protein